MLQHSQEPLRFSLVGVKYLWDIAIVDAKEVKAGFVGVVKSNVHANVDLGTLKADKPTKCDFISKGKPEEIIKAGNVTLVVTNDAKRTPHKMILVKLKAKGGSCRSTKQSIASTRSRLIRSVRSPS